MAKTPDELLRYLEELGIDARTHDHAAVHTVEESKALRGDLPGRHCKNLFLKDKKGKLWLVVAAEDTPIDMKDLRRRIGAAHLSFGKPDALMAALGVEPGSVTPLAAVNDEAGEVTVVLDQTLMAAELVNFHPLVNSKTTALAPRDLVRFLEATGHPPRLADLEGPLPETPA